MDEVLFSGKYRDWEYTVRFDLDNASREDVAYALSYIHANIEDKAFCHSGIDCAMIENAIPKGNGLNDAIAFLETKKPAEWKAFLLKAAGKEGLLAVAETKFVSMLLCKNNVNAKMCSPMFASTLKPQKQELLEGQIAFIGRYKDWVAIKKMGLTEKTQDYEVAGILSTINSTLVRKSFDFMGPDRNLEDIAAQITKGKRKSFVNLAVALKEVSQSMNGEAVHDAYLLKCVFENLGFAPYANVEALVPAYPDLKVSKPRGRFAKR
ncbi:MAG: DUF2666 family protein [Candidatus ainarchaeum sp.]|nr:DUF2666 family protein [Candidatus ainarchaeum sp.]